MLRPLPSSSLTAVRPVFRFSDQLTRCLTLNDKAAARYETSRVNDGYFSGRGHLFCGVLLRPV